MAASPDVSSVIAKWPRSSRSSSISCPRQAPGNKCPVFAHPDVPIETMHRILLLFVLLAATNAIAKDAPSRAAPEGCAWEKLDDAKLGLSGWIQHCDYHGRKINLYAKGNALLQHYSDGGEDEKLIETFELRPGEKPEAAIKRVFDEHTADKDLVARCLVKPYKGEGPTPKGAKRYTVLPN